MHLIFFLSMILTSLTSYGQPPAPFTTGDNKVTVKKYSHEGENYILQKTEIPVTFNNNNTGEKLVHYELYNSRGEKISQATMYSFPDATQGINPNPEFHSDVVKKLSPHDSQIVDRALHDRQRESLKTHPELRPKYDFSPKNSLVDSPSTIQKKEESVVDKETLSRNFNEVIINNKEWIIKRGSAIRDAIANRDRAAETFFSAGQDIAVSIRKDNSEKSSAILDALSKTLLINSLSYFDSGKISTIMKASDNPTVEIETYEDLTVPEFKNRIMSYQSKLLKGDVLQAAFELNTLIEPTITVNGSSAGLKQHLLKSIVLPDGRSFLSAKELIFNTSFLTPSAVENLKLVKMANMYQAIAVSKTRRTDSDKDFQNTYLGGAINLRLADAYYALGDTTSGDASYQNAKFAGFFLAGLLVGGVWDVGEALGKGINTARAAANAIDRFSGSPGTSEKFSKSDHRLCIELSKACSSRVNNSKNARYIASSRIPVGSL